MDELLQKRYDEILAESRPIDDYFMRVMFDDKACCEVLLRVILDKDDLTVTDVKSQTELNNLRGRSVQLDILAEDESGRVYNVEVQRSNDGAKPERARYHSSLLDAYCLQPNENFDLLPETYVIFITERDVLGFGKPLYTIERTICEADHALFNDRSHILYVNGEIRDETKLGKLMQDFFCREPEKMNYQTLAERAGNFKMKRKEQSGMGRAWDELLEEVEKRTTIQVTQEVTASKNKEIALKLLRFNSMPHEQIAEVIGVPLEEIDRLAAEIA